MGAEWLEIGGFYLLFLVVTWAVFRLPGRVSDASSRRRWSSKRRRRLRSCPTSPLVPQRPTRPIEVIVADARRLGPLIEHPPRGTSFAKLQGWRFAYDRVLTEACDALDIAHLLAVLPPSPERDSERMRVESALWLAGLRIDDAA